MPLCKLEPFISSSSSSCLGPFVGFWLYLLLFFKTPFHNPYIYAYPGPDLYMQPASNSSRSQRPYPGGDPGSHFSASSAGSVDSTMTSQSSAPRSSSSSSSRSQPSRSVVVSFHEKKKKKQAAHARSISITLVLTSCLFSHANSPINKYPRSRRVSRISW